MVRVPKTRASFGSKDGVKEWLVGFVGKCYNPIFDSCLVK